MENKEQNESTSFFLKVGWYEGWSYILLLFVAMPLKYFADMPQAVRVVGSLHGILFVLFMYAIVRCLSNRSLTFLQSIVAFVASLVPFGTFFLDKILFSKK